MRSLSLRDLINDSKRVESLSFERDDLFFDFSKQFLADETLHLLVDLASHAGLEACRRVLHLAMGVGHARKACKRHAGLEHTCLSPPGRPKHPLYVPQHVVVHRNCIFMMPRTFISIPTVFILLYYEYFN